MEYVKELTYQADLAEGVAALANESICRCPGIAHIWHTNCQMGDVCDTPHTPPPDRCEKCGGEVVSFQIIYVDDWRAQK